MDAIQEYQYLLNVIFLAWFGATVIFQFKDSRGAKMIRSVDFFSLVPLWTFFAPNPGTNDYHLLFREKNERGEKTPWTEIEINENRKLSTCIWNPQKRGKKILNDIIQTIIPLLNEYQKYPRSIVISVPYILLLNTVLKQEQISKDANSRQFLLAASNGYGLTTIPGIIMLSEFHPFTKNLNQDSC